MSVYYKYPASWHWGERYVYIKLESSQSKKPVSPNIKLDDAKKD